MGGQPALLEEFTFSLAQMIQFNAEALCGPGEYVHLDRTKASFHSFARNQLAQHMQGDWLLMLDTDHQFTPDLCLRLLDRMNVTGADVIVGLYQHRQWPHAPVLYLKNEESLYSPIGAWGMEGISPDVFTVDSAGAGCLMVRRKVFDRIRDELHESPFDIIAPFGEDHSFAKRCEKLGIKIVCDPRIECNHLQVRPISLADYDRSAVMLNEPQQVAGFNLGAA
jgi:glycosyltransferase involved in cell wall biosynthesis